METYPKIQTIFKRISETDQTLIEGSYSIPAFEFLKNNLWVFTEKVDGINMRVITGDTLTFGGKTDRANVPASLINRLHEIFDSKKEIIDKKLPKGTCLYGEGYGPTIRPGGGKYGSSQDFVLFDVKIGNWWLERHNVEDIANQLDLRVVPIIGEGTLPEMVEIARTGITSQWGNFDAEGIVARPKVELATRNGERIITKIKTCDFKSH